MEREPAERRKRKDPAARNTFREPSREELLEMLKALLDSPYAHVARNLVEVLYERHVRLQTEELRAATAETPVRQAAQGLPGGAPTRRRKA